MKVSFNIFYLNFIVKDDDIFNYDYVKVSNLTKRIPSPDKVSKAMVLNVATESEVVSL